MRSSLVEKAYNSTRPSTIWYLRDEIVTNEEQHDLDHLGIAKNAREEKLRARAARLKQDAENIRMAKLYREVVLKEKPSSALVQIRLAVAALPPELDLSNWWEIAGIS